MTEIELPVGPLGPAHERLEESLESQGASPAEQDPLRHLADWLEEAREAGADKPETMTLATVDPDGRPSARTVALKRIEAGAIIFTTSLLTRKGRELTLNPAVSLLFYWPRLGRQVHIAGLARLAERELAEELFDARPRSHQLQTVISPQGAELGSLDELRRKLAWHSNGGPIKCPSDWVAVRVRPMAVEFWQEAADRLHDRFLYERAALGWSCTRLAP